MKDQQMQELMRYYDERAPEYDDVYSGKSPGIPEPESYKQDVEEISKICKTFGRSHLIDIACGTGFWTPYYIDNCTNVTLVDQSREMLVECQKRVNGLDHRAHVRFMKGNFFSLRFFLETFDVALTAFFISHLSEEMVEVFFNKLKRLLMPKAEILWIDGAWSPKRAPYREKEGIQRRKLKNGQEFGIFKKYFDENDVKTLMKKHEFGLQSLYMGDVFFAARAELKD
jgi:demethylmenaquinone methyltransferase/2-methoxy-6-polyprenyl-1,4-benzoquinol methylase